jgi:type III secretion system YscQ/HrcQ family protein
VNVAVNTLPVDDSARDALLAQLPRLNAHAARLANLVYGCRSLSTFQAWDRALTWTWAYRAVSWRDVDRIRLAGAASDVWLAIVHDRGFCPDASLQWREHRGDAGLLAWTLSYEPLCAHLRTLLGVALEPKEVVLASDTRDRAPSENAVTLTFAIRDSTQDVLLSGAVSFDGTAVTMPEPAPLANDKTRIATLPIAFRIVIGDVRVSLGELRTLASGDVIAVGNSSIVRDGGCLRLECLGSRLTLTTRLTSAGARVEKIETTRISTARNLMQSQTELSPMTSPAAPVDVDTLPVVLNIDAGEISLSVAELSALAPGRVLSIERKLSDAPITVRINGRKIARGELVLIDDFLGVRIVELDSHGSD